ncbi:MAG TPA: hypothetical protein VII51_05250 [Gaiellaceae bacterium]
MGESRNRFGTAYALTVFTPILPGQTDEVRSIIEAVPRGEAGPFARLEQVHFTRLQIFDQLVYQGAPQKPDRLKSAYLVFTASFDGALDPFLDALCERIPAEADSWWSHCVGYPGTADRAAFKRYIQHNKVHTSLFGVAYPTASVADVRESLALRERVLDFAVAAQGLDAAALQERFRQTFAETR